MNVPNFLNEKPVDKDGNWTPVWRIILQNLLQNLQGSIGNEGFIIPPQSSSDIAILSLDAGTIIYDRTTNEFKGQVGALLKTFTLT